MDPRHIGTVAYVIILGSLAFNWYKNDSILFIFFRKECLFTAWWPLWLLIVRILVAKHVEVECETKLIFSLRNALFIQWAWIL